MRKNNGFGREFREFREFILLLAVFLGACAGKTKRVELPLHAPPLLTAEDLGRLKATLKDGKLTSERQAVKLRVDGVPVKVEFSVASSDLHPHRTLAYSGVTHEYDLKLLRHMHGYKRDQEGRYFYSSDAEDMHGPGVDLMDPAFGSQLDAHLQRSLELWVDRALILMLVDLEAQLRMK